MDNRSVQQTLSHFCVCHFPDLDLVLAVGVVQSPDLKDGRPHLFTTSSH